MIGVAKWTLKTSNVLLIHANIEGIFELVLTGDSMAKSVVYLGYLIAPMHPSGVHLFS